MLIADMKRIAVRLIPLAACYVDNLTCSVDAG